MPNQINSQRLKNLFKARTLSSQLKIGNTLQKRAQPLLNKLPDALLKRLDNLGLMGGKRRTRKSKRSRKARKTRRHP